MVLRSLAKWVLPIGILTGVILFSTGKKTNQAPRSMEPRKVTVAPVTEVRSTRELRFSGTLRAGRRASLTFTVAGRLAARPVEIGGRVKKGQVVASLDDRPFRHAEARAKAALSEISARRAQLERDVARVQKLADAKAVTLEELEQVTARYQSGLATGDAQKARWHEARRLLEEAVLKAPFAGVVTKVMMEPGEFASPGKPVISLSGDGKLELEVEVSENLLSELQGGAPVTVTLPMAGGREVPGIISSIGLASSGPGQLFPVVIAFPGVAGLIPGMTAELVLNLERSAATAVPLSAVVNPGGQFPTVYRATNGNIEKLTVGVVSLLDGKVLVTGGLQAGDQVVVAGHAGLLQGEQVEVVQ